MSGSRCRNCGKSSNPTYPISRKGAGSYNRAQRSYSSTICGPCAVEMLPHIHPRTLTTSGWDSNGLRRIAEAYRASAGIEVRSFSGSLPIDPGRYWSHPKRGTRVRVHLGETEVEGRVMKTGRVDEGDTLMDVTVEVENPPEELRALLTDNGPFSIGPAT